MRKLRSCLALLSSNGSQAPAPRGSGPMSAEVAQRLKSWVSQMELVDETEMGTALSLAPSPDYKDLVLDSEVAW